VAASLSPAAAAHFAAVAELLATLQIPCVRDSRLVRGLDYYTGTLFELTTTALGAQDAVLGGGRYDNLVAELGGAPTPAVGFAAGVERLALLVATRPRFAERQGPELFIVPMQGEPPLVARALALAAELRGLGRRVEVDVAGGKLKAQMRRADKSGAHLALVLGGDELAKGRAQLKHLVVSSQLEVALDAPAIAAALVAALGSAEKT